MTYCSENCVLIALPQIIFETSTHSLNVRTERERTEKVTVENSIEYTIRYKMLSNGGRVFWDTICVVYIRLIYIYSIDIEIAVCMSAIVYQYESPFF